MRLKQSLKYQLSQLIIKLVDKTNVKILWKHRLKYI